MAYSYWHKPNNKIVVWAFVLEFVFIAFRAPVVGADTWNYVRYLDGERNFYNYDSRALENGFIIYKDVMHFLKCMVLMAIGGILYKSKPSLMI